MKEKIENIDFKYKVTFFTFVLFLIICTLSPISGDDWKSYVIGKEGLIECFKNINIADGRIITGFLINFFSYNKILFDFSFAMLISEFVKICNDLMGTVKSKYYFLYPLIGTLIVSTFMFSYNYVSVTSTIAYTFPTIFIFIYFYLLLKDEELHIKTIIKLLLIILFVSFSSIHLAITLFITNLIYSLINFKKKNFKHFCLLITNLILLVIALTQIETNLINYDINSIFNNIPYLIDNVFSKNIILIILGAIPINCYLNEKLKGNVYGRVVITVFDLILIFSLTYNFYNYSPVNLNLILNKYNGTFATENWYYIFYFIIYLILFAVSINHYIKNRKLKITVNTYYMFSIILIVLLLISPMFDKGNIVFIAFTFILISSLLAKEMNIKIFERFIKFSIVLLVFYYLSMFAIVKYIDYTRTKYIKEQLDGKDTNIEVKANPIYLVWRYNPDYFESKDFKKYYNIKDQDTIEVKYFGIFEKIEKQVKE